MIPRTEQPTDRVGGPWMRPAADVIEAEDAWTIQVDLPGVGPQGLEIEVARGRLHVVGRRSQAEHGVPIINGYATDDFYRSWDLPSGLDPDQIEARLELGILSVRLPKPPAMQRRRIAVQIAQRVEPEARRGPP